MRYIILLVGLFGSLLFFGCSRPTATVHGTIKYQDKPLTRATIFLFAEDNQVYSAPIQTDGTYQVSAVPQGKIRVAIQVEEPRVFAKADPDLRKAADTYAKEAEKVDDAKAVLIPKNPTPAPKKGPQFPTNYGDPSTSGLSFDLNQEKFEYSPELK